MQREELTPRIRKTVETVLGHGNFEMKDELTAADVEGWDSLAAYYGWAVLGCNLVLIAAYWRCYAPLFALRAEPRLPGAVKPVEALP